MGREKAIIFDLDGTIANTDHRAHFMQQRPKDRKSFHDAAYKDPVHKWCKDMMLGMYDQGYGIIILTCRDASHREATEKWLGEKCIYYDKLLMREVGDHRPDGVVKKEIYLDVIEPHYEIAFTVEDRQCSVDAWRSLGLVCLQCARGDF